MSAHTPGEWEAVGRYVRTPLEPRGGGWMIADCRDVSLPWEQVEANARLIAAAPELLEALESIRDLPAHPMRKRAVEIATAAIAKATGVQA